MTSPCSLASVRQRNQTVCFCIQPICVNGREKRGKGGCTTHYFRLGRVVTTKEEAVVSRCPSGVSARTVVSSKLAPLRKTG